MRASDELLQSSPVREFALASEGPWTPQALPADAITLSHKPRGAWVRSFAIPPAPSGGTAPPGGFVQSVFDFPTAATAQAASAELYAFDICRAAGQPMIASGDPSILIAVHSAPGTNTLAYWVDGRRLFELKFSMWGNKSDLTQATATIAAAWQRSQSKNPT